MSNVTFEIKIKGDSDGYITFECPFCESKFKLNISEFQDKDNPITELFCPYCGLTDEVSSFYSKEVQKQVEALSYNYVAEQVNKAFEEFENIFKGDKYIKVNSKKLKKVNTKDLKDKDTTEEIISCPICKNHVKALYCVGISKVFCPYCGVDI